jgi:dTDP-4-amino-4,6-dideoxygalactose transaminase
MVIEDCSHAHGTLYKGRPAGSFGDVSAFSLMTGKSFAIGEAGILLTDDRHIYERALLWGHYARHNEIESENLKKYAGLPCGGCKNRMHQLSSAFGLVQLKYYPDQMEEIDNAMNYFCDLLEDTPGVRSIRPAENSGSSKGGWYYPHFKYVPEELDGLSITRFADAVSAEGSVCNPGCNKPLHLHPLFTDMDVFGDNKPTRFANLPEDTDKSRYMSTLPVSEQIVKQVFEVPWFKKFRRNIIEMHADAYKKVISNHKLLLENDNKDMDVEIGAYSSFFKNS